MELSRNINHINTLRRFELVSQTSSFLQEIQNQIDLFAFIRWSKVKNKSSKVGKFACFTPLAFADIRLMYCREVD